MEVKSTQQIEEELRRALKLNQDQPPPLNTSQSKNSSYLLASTSVPMADAHPAHKGTPQVCSSVQNAIISPSCTSASDKIPTASSSSPSITNSAQASCVSGAGSARCRKPRHSKPNSAQRAAHDATGVSSSGKNMPESQKSAVKSGSPQVIKCGSPRDNTAAAITNPVSVVGGIPSLMSLSSNVRIVPGTMTNQRGAKASRGRGVMGMSVMPHQAGTAFQGRGIKNHTGASTVPAQLPLQKPPMGDDDLTRDVTKHDAALSGQLLYADNNVNVKSAPLPRPNENMVMDQSSNEAAAKIAQNSIKQLVKKHEKACSGFIHVLS